LPCNEIFKQQVLANADTYIQQLSKVIDIHKCQVRFNGDWLDGLTFRELLQLLAKVTVAQLLDTTSWYGAKFAACQP
jgi:tyrosyl-tRNA synthetase